jgi:uncharacterized tellurite resistance protein B-like protein
MPYSDLLELAFAYDVVRRLVGADDRIDPTEAAFLERTFPWAMLQARGLVGQDGAFTPEFEQAVKKAREVLPKALETEEKLALVSVFVGAAVADEYFDHAEGKVVLEAVHALGLSTDEFLTHIGKLDSVGDVDLDEPEPES